MTVHELLKSENILHCVTSNARSIEGFPKECAIYFLLVDSTLTNKNQSIEDVRQIITEHNIATTIVGRYTYVRLSEFYTAVGSL